MRSLRNFFLPIAILGMGIVLLLGGFARSGLATTGGDPLSPLPGTLEEILEQALRSNPEILVGQAKLREAQAELNQRRLSVTQQVVRLHFQRDEDQQLIQQKRKSLQRLQQMVTTGTISDEEVRAVSIEIAQAEGNLARVEADLRYAMGAGGSGEIDPAVHTDPWGQRYDFQTEVEPAPAPRPQVPESIAAILDGKRIQVEFHEQPLREVAQFLSQVSGLNFLLSPPVANDEIVLTLNLQGEVSLRQLFHAIADLTEVHFAVREYGILAVWAGEQPAGSPLIPESLED